MQAMMRHIPKYDKNIKILIMRQFILALGSAVLYSLCIVYFSTMALQLYFFPVSGLATVIILRQRKIDLIGIFTGIWFALYFFGHQTPIFIGLAIAGGVLEALFAAKLLTSYPMFNLQLSTPQGFLYLYLVSAFVPVVSSACLMVARTATQAELGPDFLAMINQYWMGDSLGIVLWLSLILVWRERPYYWHKPYRKLEFAALMLLVFVIGQIIFNGWLYALFGQISRGYWMFLVVLIVAIRLSLHGVTVMLILTTFQALHGALNRQGFFANDIEATHLLNLWNYIAALTIVGMILAIILKSRHTNETNLQQHQHQLRVAQRLAGIASWSWDLRNDQHWWADEIYKVYGRDPALGPASYPDVKQYFTEQSWQHLSQSVEHCVLTGHTYECDAEVIQPLGSRRWIVARGEAERDALGKVIMMRGTIQDITERKQAQLQIASSEAAFRSLFEDSPTAMLTIEPFNGRILQANSKSTALWGYAHDELLKLNIIEITHPDDVLFSQVRMDLHYRDEVDNNDCFQKRYVKKNGLAFWAEVSYTLVRDDAGQAKYSIVSVIDISERKKIEQELLHLSMAVEQSPESIVITNTDGVIEYVNDAYLKKSGYAAEELLGKNSRVVQSGNTPMSTYKSLWQTLSRGETWEGEFINRTKAGIEYTEHAIISPIRQTDGCITHYVAVKEDITEKINSSRRIYRLAYFDEITDLPNFVMLQEHILQQMLKSNEYSSFSALITLNLDRFKNVVDANGQEVTNGLLKQVGARLVQNLHSTDVVSRSSGDEFCIFLPDVDKDLPTAAHLVMQVSQKLHACMRAPFELDCNEVIMSACHGIALFNGHNGETPLDVIRRASTALHHAKSRGGEQSMFFEPGLEQLVKQRFLLEGELRHAIKHHEFVLYLQSQVNQLGVVMGAEALIRWQHPTKGLISPVRFIPIAEETNLIIDIDDWVLGQICRLIAELPDSARTIRFSVNISARHFNQPDFVTQIKQVVNSSGANPAQLTLEITEGVVIGNIDDVIAKMQALSGLGIHFSMDDFGTGYSSLSYLKRLPIQEIKIDKSFIQEVNTDANDAALVEVILAVAKHLNLKIVAEGVETVEQAAFLNQRAHVLHQGYLFSKPEPIASWLARLSGETK